MLKSLKSGFKTKNTPKKPIKIAPHLKIPTYSPIINLEKIVTKKGLTKKRVTASGNEILDKEK